MRRHSEDHRKHLVSRTKRPMWSRPWPAPALLGAILGTQLVAALIAGFGILIQPIPWVYVALIWAYCLAWVFVEDLIKLVLYGILHRRTAGHPEHRSPIWGAAAGARESAA